MSSSPEDTTDDERWRAAAGEIDGLIAVEEEQEEPATTELPLLRSRAAKFRIWKHRKLPEILFSLAFVLGPPALAGACGWLLSTPLNPSTTNGFWLGLLGVILIVLGLFSVFVSIVIFFFSLSDSGLADLNRQSRLVRLEGEDRLVGEALLVWLARYRRRDELRLRCGDLQRGAVEAEMRDLVTGMQYHASLLPANRVPTEVASFLAQQKEVQRLQSHRDKPSPTLVAK